MHFHLPKPLHGWREFAGEVGIIVLGVLIALGVEQSVEAIRERQLARDANDAIHTEMQENVQRLDSRLSQQACLDRRLDQIADVLAQWNNGKVPAAGLNIGVPSDIPMVEQRWQANLNSGRFNQQSASDQAEQASFYTGLGILNQILAREHDRWAELRTLELGPRMLSTDMRGGLVAALQSARTEASDFAQLGQHLKSEFERAGNKPKSAGLIWAITGGICGPIHPH